MEVLQTNGAVVKAEEAPAAAAVVKVEPSPFTVDEDDLLNFSLDDAVDNQNIDGFLKPPTYSASIPLLGSTFPECMEEELEWLSNKDAFPSVETCFDLVPVNSVLNSLDQHSPVSVLENSNSSSCSASNGSSIASGSTVMSSYGPNLQVPAGFPARARTKRLLKPRAGLAEFTQQLMWWKKVSMEKQQNAVQEASKKRRHFPGRKCQHCQTDQTPQWRAGPLGPKTLCNACGVRYKSGRLVPEYRPANSPTYVAAKHSNSHRKIVEMRRQKQAVTGGGFMENGFVGVENGFVGVSNGFVGVENGFVGADCGAGLMKPESRRDNGEQHGLWI